MGSREKLTGLALVWALGLAASPARAEERRTIEAVELRRQNVFTEGEAASAFIPFGLANGFHATTRPSLIEKELLFRIGDPLDPERLKETERNLRARQLFRSVAVTYDGPKVVVRTADAWTFLPRLALSNKGGEFTYQFGLEERNLFGTGRQLEFRYDRGTERLSRSLFYLDPHLFAPHVQFQLSASDLSDGTVFEVGIARPFFALFTEQAGSVAFRNATFDATLYSGGEADTRWRKSERLLRLEGGRMLRRGETSVVRAFGLVDWSDVKLFPGGLGEDPPDEDPRRFLFLGVGLERQADDWIKRRNVDQSERDEDFNMAPVGRIEVAVSPKVLRARGGVRYRASGSVGLDLGWGFGLLSASVETRFSGDVKDATRFGVELKGFFQRPGVTVATRLAYTVVGQGDPEMRLELDGLSGLRGYRLHAVSGTARAVANLEVRVFLIPEILNLFSLGVAAFVDEGLSTGPPDGVVHLTDIGVGLRIGLSRASKRSLLRVDVARAVRADPLGRQGWLLSFASGQAF